MVVRGFGVKVRVAIDVDVTVTDPASETTTSVEVSVTGISARSCSEKIVREPNPPSVQDAQPGERSRRGRILSFERGTVDT